ncbi:hypothetical protein [Rhodopseudomonas palustris]|uniref:Uncharacterized protein n=1 Tax=Rhodopseudomonas palustris TaxID=1076 RepID=A0A418V1T5_RHOPL|nr:hypothetical protein [Rhodopseudomonas palustris]RJF69829.1 hypothetical protein D4Q52_19525 [Rhodopseudomonas palustris]
MNNTLSITEILQIAMNDRQSEAVGEFSRVFECGLQQAKTVIDELLALLDAHRRTALRDAMEAESHGDYVVFTRNSHHDQWHSHALFDRNAAMQAAARLIDQFDEALVVKVIAKSATIRTLRSL